MIQDSIKKMETRIAAAQEDMRTAFAELKKIEITQENRDKREARKVQKKEDLELDDIAVEQFRRKESD